MTILYWHSVPVPYAAAWTDEEEFWCAPCPHAGGRIAVCQKEARGSGKPIFGTPHMVRQREVIAKGLCDLCARPLKNRTKVSLSHARSQHHAASPMDVLQFEPLLHTECALISMKHCPSLKRDISAGTLMIRQVMRYRVQIALVKEEAVEQQTGERRKAIGHAKVQLVKWKDRDLAWLEKHGAASVATR